MTPEREAELRNRTEFNRLVVYEILDAVKELRAAKDLLREQYARLDSKNDDLVMDCFEREQTIAKAREMVERAIVEAKGDSPDSTDPTLYDLRAALAPVEETSEP